MLPSLHSVTPTGLQDQLKAWGEPVFRCNQVLDWLYRKRVGSLEEMYNCPKALRQRLGDAYRFALPRCQQVQGSADTTRKYLWRLEDGALVEKLRNGALYRLAFNYRADYEADDAFLISNGEAEFLVSGQVADLEFLSKEQQAVPVEDEGGAEEAADDLMDFSMF